MSARRHAIGRQAQAGAVAVEAAFCMAFILLPLFAFVFIFGNFFWYYTAAQKSVHDAALYMSGAPLAEVRNNDADVLATEILMQETADIRPTASTQPSIECGYSPNSTVVLYRECVNNLTPVAVQATLVLSVPQPFFSDYLNAGDITIIVFSQMPYVGK